MRRSVAEATIYEYETQEIGPRTRFYNPGFIGLLYSMAGGYEVDEQYAQEDEQEQYAGGYEVDEQYQGVDQYTEGYEGDQQYTEDHREDERVQQQGAQGKKETLISIVN